MMSWRARPARASAGRAGACALLRCNTPAQDFHEAAFPPPSMHGARRLAHTALAYPPPWSVDMKWETPAAAEFRFGFEITMYIANR